MNPDFGIGLRRYLFELNDAELAHTIQQKIIEQIARYEPLASIIDMQFKQVENEMKIKITYRLKDAVGSTSALELSEKMS